MKTKRILSILVIILLGRTTWAQEADTTATVHTLSEAVVSGWVGSTMLKHSPMPITLISSSDLAYTVSTNIIDALSHQPGVSQITTGSGISKPVIRGLGFNRVVVVADGIRQEGQQWGEEHGIEIDANNVYSAEVLKGPSSLMYGSDAMSGVIIFHDAPVCMPGSITTTASSEYQSNNGLIGLSARTAGNLDGFVWDVRLSSKYAHAYRNRFDGLVYNSGFNERSVSGMFGLNRGWGYSHIKASYYNTHLGIVEGSRDEATGKFTKEELSGGEKVSAIVQEKELGSYGLGLPWQNVDHLKVVSDNSFILGEGNLKALVGYQRNVRQEFEELETPDEPCLDFLLQTVNYDVHYRSADYSGWKFLSGVGGMGQSSSNRGDEFLIPSYRLFDIGVFATTQKQLGRWMLSGGLRYDARLLSSDSLVEEGEERFKEFSRNFQRLTGSIGATCQISDAVSLRANLARGFRSPNISELSSNGVHEGTERYERGNNNLKPEHSWQGDVGMTVETEKLDIDASLFLNRIGNYIYTRKAVGEQIDDHDVYDYVSGDALLCGGELSVDWHIIRNLHFENDFSYVYGSRLGADACPLPMIPAPKISSDLRYDIPRITKTFKNTFALIGVEGHLSQNRFYAENGTETATPGYTLLNMVIGTGIEVKGRKLMDIYLNGNNLTDTCYQDHLSRLKYTDFNLVTARQGIFNMGRNFGIKIIINLEWMR